MILVPLVKIIYVRICFWDLYSISSMYAYMSLCQYHNCFDYYGFIVCFEIVKSETSNFVRLFQDCVCYLGALEIPYEF